MADIIQKCRQRSRSKLQLHLVYTKKNLQLHLFEAEGVSEKCLKTGLKNLAAQESFLLTSAPKLLWPVFTIPELNFEDEKLSGNDQQGRQSDTMFGYLV